MPKEYIGCRSCDSPSCEGCNIYILDTMLRKGKFDRIMYEHTVNPYADIVEVVRCGECIHHNRAITPGRVICDKHAILRNDTNFCSDGRRDER